MNEVGDFKKRRSISPWFIYVRQSNRAVSEMGLQTAAHETIALVNDLSAYSSIVVSTAVALLLSTKCQSRSSVLSTPGPLRERYGTQDVGHITFRLIFCFIYKVLLWSLFTGLYPVAHKHPHLTAVCCH